MRHLPRRGFEIGSLCVAFDVFVSIYRFVRALTARFQLKHSKHKIGDNSCRGGCNFTSGPQSEARPIPPLDIYRGYKSKAQTGTYVY